MKYFLLGAILVYASNSGITERHLVCNLQRHIKICIHVYDGSDIVLRCMRRRRHIIVRVRIASSKKMNFPAGIIINS